MGRFHYTKEEIARLGKDIYEREIRPEVEAEHHGEYIVIDVETGEYEIDLDHFAASQRAYDKNPDGARFAMRIGYSAMGRIGSAAVSDRP